MLAAALLAEAPHVFVPRVAPPTASEAVTMRVVISWDGRGDRADLAGVIEKVTAKYPNAVFLVPESFNGFASNSIIGVCTDAGACVVQYMLNRKKLGEQAYLVACRRAVIEGDASAAVIVGADEDLETALREWPGSKLWKLDLPEPTPTEKEPA
jgi:hypothetical protein